MSRTEAIAGISKEKLTDKDTQKMVSFYNMFLVNLLKFSEHGCFVLIKNNSKNHKMQA